MDDRVLERFLDTEGRLHTIPVKRAKLLVVLDHLAQSFEPGEVYPEPEVNELLRRFHPDVATLRRHLVDHQFLSRRAGSYWRTGGTFHIEL